MRAGWLREVLSIAVLASLSACVPSAPAAERAPVAAFAARAAAIARAGSARAFWVEAPIPGDPSPIRAHVPTTGVVIEGTFVRLQPPVALPRTRRVGIQAGHWKVEEAPAEFPNLRFQLGGSSNDVNEVDVNLAVAGRVVDMLRASGVTVDLLPATIPPGYVADAFVAIHADSIDSDDASGFKVAHGFYRGPYDDDLVQALDDEYAKATDLQRNGNISSDMTDYYAFAWYRYEHSLAPHTPAAIIELGYISNADDLSVLLDRQEAVARGIAQGIRRFLATVPRARLFAEDIVVPIVSAP